MQVNDFVQDTELNSRFLQTMQQVENLTLDEKAKLAQKLLSIPELSVVSNEHSCSNFIRQIKMMPLEQLGRILEVIGQQLTESRW